MLRAEAEGLVPDLKHLKDLTVRLEGIIDLGSARQKRAQTSFDRIGDSRHRGVASQWATVQWATKEQRAMQRTQHASGVY